MLATHVTPPVCLVEDGFNCQGASVTFLVVLSFGNWAGSGGPVADSNGRIRKETFRWCDRPLISDVCSAITWGGGSVAVRDSEIRHSEHGALSDVDRVFVQRSEKPIGRNSLLFYSDGFRAGASAWIGDLFYPISIISRPETSPFSNLGFFATSHSRYFDDL